MQSALGMPVAQLCPVEAVADVRVTPGFVHGLHLVHENLYTVQDCTGVIQHLRNHLHFVDCSSAACFRLFRRLAANVWKYHASAFGPSMPCLVSKSTVALLFELVNICQLQLELCLPRHQVECTKRPRSASRRPKLACEYWGFFLLIFWFLRL